MKRKTMQAMVDEYIRYKRDLGFVHRANAYDLHSFAKFADEYAYGQPLTINLAIRWATNSQSGPKRHVGLIDILRPFAEYLCTIDPRTELIPRKILGPRSPRPVPYIYSDTEIVRLMETEAYIPERKQCNNTFSIIVGLLACNGMIHLTGKGRKERTVPLWKDTIKLLRKWIESNRYSSDSYLFPNNRGGKMTRSAIAKMLTTVVETAKTQCPTLKSQKISPHTLRHTTAMHLLQSGVDITVIAMWLGHERIETTNIYLSADMTMKEKALQAMQPPKTKDMRFRPKGSLLELLESQ